MLQTLFGYFNALKTHSVATKIDKIFTVYLTLTTLCQIGGEDFVNFWDIETQNLGKDQTLPAFPAVAALKRSRQSIDLKSSNSVIVIKTKLQF